MKKIILFAVVVFSITGAVAQSASRASFQRSFMDGFRDPKAANTLLFITPDVYTSEAKGSQFYYPGFTEGSVTTTHNEKLDSGYLFLYDKINQQLYLREKPRSEKDKPMSIEAEKDQIRRFTLKDETEGEHSFIAASTFDSANKTDFYEVLAESKTGYTFVRSIQTSLERKNTSDAEKILKNEGQDEYTDKYTYYVSFKNAKPVLVDMKRKKLSAAFAPEMKIVIDNYLSSHRNDDIDYRFIIKMVTSINQQYYL